ncbi:GNAT family N-acetyltransferase [Streptomyces sp. NPDC048639]|uniref:GNAT family N-acetyltransferase n=1 Tax=Streptomyces sp. NPDC048639 TaxID=3365581 RepID=UPI003716F6D3
MTADTEAAYKEAAPARTAPAVTGLTVRLCRDPDRFASLEPEWDRLYRRCRTATPFQTHAWLHSWWLSYGASARLRLLLAYRGNRLVGAAPLMMTYRPLPALVFLGGGISDYQDVLIDDSCAGAAAAGLAGGLRRAARRAVVDLREVRPGAAAERVVQLWRGPEQRLGDSVCLELPALPFDALLRRLPGPAARRSRAKVRKLDALGVEYRGVPDPEVPEAVLAMLRLHCLQWQGRGVTPEHRRPRFAEHLVRAVGRMAMTGDAVVTEYRRGSRVLALDVTLTSPELAGGYLYGAHPELRAAKADITTMLLRHDSDLAVESGRGTLSLLRGNEDYKHHWRPVTVVNQRFLLAREELAPALRLYAGQIAGRARLAEAARSRFPALLLWRSRLNNVRAVAGRTAGAGRAAR